MKKMAMKKVGSKGTMYGKKSKLPAKKNAGTKLAQQVGQQSNSRPATIDRKYR